MEAEHSEKLDKAADLFGEVGRLRQELKNSRANERRYRDFFTNATDIVFTVDRKGRFRLGNQSFFGITGYTVEEGLKLDWDQLVAPHEWNRASQIYREHAIGEGSSFFELDIVTKAGELCTVEIHSRPVTHKSKVIGFHGIARDITERKRTQKSLEQARLEAQAAGQAKTQLLAKISHEIRTPLHGVMNLLTAVDTSSLREVDQKMVEPINRSIRHLVHLVDETLNFAYLDSGQSAIRNISFSIASIAKACAARHKHSAEQKALFLHLDIDSKLPERISGDPTKTTQILDNLITNAIRYTSNGGVTVKILSDGEHASNDRFAIIVSDTGPGISEQQIDSIFEPFQQADTRQDQSNGGVGLGLAITKQLVETLGYELKVESALGVGSDFILSIPIRLSDLGTPYTQTAKEFDGTGVSTLVVDDDEVSSIFLTDVLAATGIKAEICASGAEVVRLMQSKNYDLIFTDQHLSDIHGTDLAEQIQSDKRNHVVKIICVTADIELHQTTALESPFDQILLKPCSQSDLISTLATLFPSRSNMSTNDILDQAVGISIASGNSDIWEKAVKMFIDKLPAVVEQLELHHKNQVFEELRGVAHKLVGSSRYVGAQNLADSSTALVDACKAKDSTLIDEAFNPLLLAIEEFKSAANDSGGNPKNSEEH